MDNYKDIRGTLDLFQAIKKDALYIIKEAKQIMLELEQEEKLVSKIITPNESELKRFIKGH